MEKLVRLFEKAKNDYAKNHDGGALIKSLENIASLYRDYFGVGDLLLSYGEELISTDRYADGIAVFRVVEESFRSVANQTLLCIRLGEWEFEKGNFEKGKEYLTRLISKVDNYEEVIEFNELSEIWNKYKSHLDNIPKSANIMTAKAREPEECAHGIKEILELERDEMLSELSEHLNELSADGEEMYRLTTEEKNVLLVDEFMTDVNSDGIFHYLYWRGEHFGELISAAVVFGVVSFAELLSKIKDKLTKGAVPKDTKKIERCLEKMERAGIDFEDEESFYYDKVEGDLIDAMSKYVINNSESFR